METFSDAAARFPGCLGAQLVRPGDEVDVADSLYHAVLAFANPDCLRAWQDSPARLQGLTAASAFIEGQVMVPRIMVLTVLVVAVMMWLVAP